MIKKLVRRLKDHILGEQGGTSSHRKKKMSADIIVCVICHKTPFSKILSLLLKSFKSDTARPARQYGSGAYCKETKKRWSKALSPENTVKEQLLICQMTQIWKWQGLKILSSFSIPWEQKYYFEQSDINIAHVSILHESVLINKYISNTTNNDRRQPSPHYHVLLVVCSACDYWCSLNLFGLLKMAICMWCHMVNRHINSVA